MATKDFTIIAEDNHTKERRVLRKTTSRQHVKWMCRYLEELPNHTIRCIPDTQINREEHHDLH